MASSSSESNHQWIYDVFLNFRGGDTRNNFVSHLYAALSNAGINTFFDDESLRKGDELEPELLRAIEGSQISLVVFSETYAESSWCLKELDKIMECRRTLGQRVVPIFCNIDPWAVRNQRGAFGEALKRHEMRNANMKYVSRWKEALKTAANTIGWGGLDRNEAKLVEKIVRDVLQKLDDTFLSITEFPVGLESRVQEVIGFIKNQSSKVCIVGIWGMGGSGKTTLAKAIYNQIHRKFADRSFIENVREVCQTARGHIDLQEQLLSDVLSTKVQKIHSIAMGATMVEKRLYGKRALIVLDDVTDSKQLNALCGNCKWIGSGSVIIITTRDVRVLKELKVDREFFEEKMVDRVYEVKELDRNESHKLFSWHAFKRSGPGVDFLKLSTNVVTYCGGLPLALEVLGSYLFERTKAEWENVLSKLERIPNDQIQEKLRISFDGLKDRMEKNIFLDICCFFIGKNRTYVTDILNGCGFCADIGIEVLKERSLIKVDKKNKLQIHDLLRDMGTEIVRESSPEEPEKHSRLWRHDEVLDVLTEKTGTNAVEGLALKLERTSRVCFDANAFDEMKKLRLLQLDHVKLTGDYGCLSKRLRWLYWKGFPLSHIHNSFYQGNLVAIDLKHSKLELVWKKPQLLEWLKLLNLSHSKYLANTPDFSKLPNLERLILKDCPSLSGLHNSIGDLRKLVLLNLMDCTRLSDLPRVMYKLKQLKTLILSGCSKIENLEEDIVQMESLTTLIAKGTAIKQVPFSIVRSTSIGYISLCGYEGLARNVFPSLIRSWMSPTMNPLSFLHPSLFSMDVQNDNVGGLSSMLGSLSKFKSLEMQFRSEFQLTHGLIRILNDTYDANLTELEATSNASQISEHCLSSLLIGMGHYHQVLNTLNESISEELITSRSGNIFLPGDNYPYWLTHIGEGHSVIFKVPPVNDCCMKGMILCVVHSSIPESLANECFVSVLIINYTKCTVQLYKRDTEMSFNDEEWQGILTNLGPDDKVEIRVAFGHGLTVNKTAVYLIYGEPIDMKMESSPEPEESRKRMRMSMPEYE